MTAPGTIRLRDGIRWHDGVPVTSHDIKFTLGRDGYAALFPKAAELFREFVMARADGSHPKLLDRLGRVDLLIVDDWAMAPMTEIERRDFLESLRHPLSDAIYDADQPTAGCHLACPNRRSDHRR